MNFLTTSLQSLKVVQQKLKDSKEALEEINDKNEGRKLKERKWLIVAYIYGLSDCLGKLGALVFQSLVLHLMLQRVSCLFILSVFYNMLMHIHCQGKTLTHRHLQPASLYSTSLTLQPPMCHDLLTHTYLIPSSLAMYICMCYIC